MTDRIEKRVVLRAPRARVWRAIANAEEFGTWVGARLGSSFAPGARVQGQITIPGYEHVTLDVTVERVEPERFFSYRWHPYAVEPGVDYSGEPTTLVEFHLEEVPGGTELTVIESGFDRIPLARRAKAFEANEGGWAAQLRNIQKHVTA
ncbi:MAG TPA: SRPBCC family protein [Vicinamibacteria bacterium]|nr:SRPBCC family protein [Vicinamibacteria bacterium]